MNVCMIALACPICHTEQALRCQVVRTGEGLWVSLRQQECTCEVYTAWDVVWWAARRQVQQAGCGK
jgi:hypothetical protein